MYVRLNPAASSTIHLRQTGTLNNTRHHTNRDGEHFVYRAVWAVMPTAVNLPPNFAILPLPLLARVVNTQLGANCMSASMSVSTVTPKATGLIS